jgi:hypothetical protein
MKSKDDGGIILAGKVEALARGARFTRDSIHVLLADRREVSAPLQWLPRPLNATTSRRAASR